MWVQPSFLLHDAVNMCFPLKECLHISLSKPFSIPKYVKKSMTMAINKMLSGAIGSFVLSFDKPFFLLLNECRKRVFVCLSVHDASESLIRIVQKLDIVLVTYGYSKFFSTPKFHLSIASIEAPDKRVLSDTDISTLERLILPELNSYALHTDAIKVKHVVFKIGVNVSKIPI